MTTNQDRLQRIITILITSMVSTFTIGILLYFPELRNTELVQQILDPLKLMIVVSFLINVFFTLGLLKFLGVLK